ncbi:putative host specificity protein J [Escherichia coli P0304777.12]|nr:putative host specificity protein J [Escherichia coli P0304777.12]
MLPEHGTVGVQVDSEQFGSQQVSRNYHLAGDSAGAVEYNPQTRQYSGIWDGTFNRIQQQHGLVLWDMLTHPRYGMGNVWCADVKMGAVCHRPDATSRCRRLWGTEPRITCNAT